MGLEPQDLSGGRGGGGREGGEGVVAHRDGPEGEGVVDIEIDIEIMGEVEGEVRLSPDRSLPDLPGQSFQKGCSTPRGRLEYL